MVGVFSKERPFASSRCAKAESASASSMSWSGIGPRLVPRAFLAPLDWRYAGVSAMVAELSVALSTKVDRQDHRGKIKVIRGFIEATLWKLGTPQKTE